MCGLPDSDLEDGRGLCKPKRSGRLTGALPDLFHGFDSSPAVIRLEVMMLPPWLHQRLLDREYFARASP